MMNKTVNQTNIYISIVNETANFKIRLPWTWCKEMGIDTDNKSVCISVEGANLVVKKATDKLFLELNKKEKSMQIKKYLSIYGQKYNKKELMSKMEEYFQVSYRTIYRLLKEEIDEAEIENVELIKNQNSLERNVNIILSNYKNSIIATISIPTSLAMIFLNGKTYEELKIKTAVEIYTKNTKIPVNRYLRDDKIIIERA